MKRKIQVTVMLAQQQLETLDILSAKTGKSRSRLIGEALSRYLKTTEKPNSVAMEGRVVE